MQQRNWYNAVQGLLLAFAINCILIAFSSFVFGENNFLSNSPYPTVILTIILAIWLARQDW